MTIYTVADYGRMLADEGRIGPYIDAMRAAIRPGDVVVDVGTGTGIAALWACKLGACRVYAIDDNPAIDLARRAAKASGYGDRITFVEALSTEISLPEKADVVVADLRGSLPFMPGNLESTADARARLLKPGGILIPSRDLLMAGLVSAPAHYATWVTPYERAGFDMTAAREAVLNSIHRESPGLPADALLTSAAPWATIEYGAPPPDALVGRVSFEVLRAGTAHAWSIWFDAKLFGDIGFSNAPGTALVYGRTLAPLVEPLEVAEKDTIDLTIFARRVGGPSWIWGLVTTHIPRDGRPRRELRQASTDGFIRPGDDDQPVRARPMAPIARRALELLGSDEPRSTSAIAEAVFQEFGPVDLGAGARFDKERATVLVRDLASRYGERKR